MGMRLEDIQKKALELERISDNDEFLFQKLNSLSPDSLKTVLNCYMLLYSTIKNNFKDTFQHCKHKIKIASIDLNQDWETIKENLLNLIQ